MTRLTLLLRSLRGGWRSHLPVLLGVAAATATIVGALLVGDSVRGSLREMTRSRLGRIDHVVHSQQFVTDALADRLNERLGPDAAAGAILLPGTLRGEAGGVVQVDIVGVDDDGWAMLETTRSTDQVSEPASVPQPSGETIVPNLAAIEPLGVVQGGRLSIESGIRFALLTELPSAIPRDTLLGDRDEQVVELSVALTGDAADPTGTGGIVPSEVGAARFSLNPSQQLPKVVYVDRAFLQDQLDLSPLRPSRSVPEGRIGRVNTLLIDRDGAADGPGADEELRQAFRDSLTLDDFGLAIESAGDGLSVQTRSLILPSALEDAAREAAATLDAEAGSVLVYLVNEIRSAGDGEKYSAYSVAAGVDIGQAGFVWDGPAPGLPLAEGEVIVNRWLADDLGVAIGDAIEVDAFPAGSIGDVPEQTLSYTVAGIAAMEGAGADPTLTPSVPGITDADSFADWEQPFDMDLGRVTDRDETYWDDYRAAPKLFLPLDQMQRQFSSRYGDATSVRIATGDRDGVEAAILDAIRPEALGLTVQPIRKQQLAAAAGTTDFAGLFLGFSFFLIAAAVLLVGLLFRLAIERRAGQLGLLRSVGFTPAAIRRLLLAEGLAVAIAGGLLGVAGGIGFARLMLYGLSTWWSGAIGAATVDLHVPPGSLAIGLAIAVVTAAAAMFLAIRQLATLSPRSLLAGRTESALAGGGRSRRQRRAKRIAAAAAAFGGVLLILTLTGVLGSREAFAGFSLRIVAFFLVGTLALVAAIATLAALLDRPSTDVQSLTLTSLTRSNASRARSRSLLTTALVASACFVLVAVAVARRDPASEQPQADSGNGGYILIAESASPILYDLSTDDGRRKAGVGDWPRDIVVVQIARRPGDDASCLNLYQAQLPTLLGIPDDVLRRWSDENRFRFADTPDDGRWGGLLAGGESAAVPVIGDMNTLLYSLKTGIGDRIAIPESAGDGQLEVIGMLDSSVFQGVLLMRESDLRRLFPDVVGDRTFLVAADDGLARRSEISRQLESGLADYGLDAEPVAERIANFLAVQNTYLSTFQTLGGLGLLLGTLGVATVMLRNVTERRGELALMQAIGFPPRRLRRLVGRENLLLMLYGLAAGTIAALLAMLPHLLSTGADVPWGSLLLLLAAIAAVGVVALQLASRVVGRGSLVTSLRGE